MRSTACSTDLAARGPVWRRTCRSPRSGRPVTVSRRSSRCPCRNRMPSGASRGAPSRRRCRTRRRRGSTGSCARAAGSSPSVAAAHRCRSRHVTSACCSGGSCRSARTSRDRMSRRWRRGASRTCWSAAARFTAARRSRRCARRWPPSSGRTTSSRSSRRCAVPCSRSAMRSSSSIATSRAASIRSACPTPCPRTWRPLPTPAACCGSFTGSGTAGPWRTRSPACWTRYVPTRASCCGRAASRCWQTCCTSRNWRVSTKWTAACPSAGSWSGCTMRLRARRRPKRRCWRKALTVSV